MGDADPEANRDEVALPSILNQTVRCISLGMPAAARRRRNRSADRYLAASSPVEH